ncbi:MAG: protein kinase, partial [Myxococcota bacterium]|nr:protein kinase [Myxococcota bacterium]
MTWDGRYRLERTLGEGGMGRVLLARDLVDDERTVALKILLPEYRHSTTGFLKEFVTQRSFNHPNIPSVHELGFTQHPRGGEVPYFTLEYCAGVPLILAIPRVKSLKQVWPWMVQVLRALDYIHSRGWLHRDMKPGNVLVNMKDTGDTSTQLIDLGVASRIGAPPEKVFIGTPEYCAPEMLSGRRFDQRADLYAFGLVLYEVIERRRPWPGSSEVELLTGRLKTPPPPIAHPECPTGIKELIGALLQPSPKDRPVSAAHVLESFYEAIGKSSPLETSDAFAVRLGDVMFSGREDALSAGDHCIGGLTPDGDLDGNQPRILLVQAPRGQDAGWVIHELADRAAIQGARVIRIDLKSQADEPMEALEPALAVLRRLRQDTGDGGSPSTQHGQAGAAALLTRLNRPTVLLLENIQRADQQSLEVLRVAMDGARVANLRVLATLDPTEAATSPEALAGLQESRFVHSSELSPLTLDDTATWLEETLGRGVVDVPLINRLHAESGGTAAGLKAATAEIFRQGLVHREVEGYRIQGDSGELEQGQGADTSQAELMIACMRRSLPADIVASYLEVEADKIPGLLSTGVLSRETSGSLSVTDETWRAGVYRGIPAVHKMRYHRKLARAIHEAPSFPNQRSLVAFELIHSDRPALAAPHLVVAASEAVGAETAARAREYLDRASELLQRHEDDSSAVDTWQWWVMLWKARVRLAMAEGDLDGLDEATAALVELGTDKAHIPTLRFALETRMMSAQERGDWEGLVSHAKSRLALDGPEPGSDARGLEAWAIALRQRARGQVDEALTTLKEAESIGPERPRPAVGVRLAAARADLLVSLCRIREGESALRAYEQAAEEAGDEAEKLRARILGASTLRHSGQPEASLLSLRAIAAEMPPDHMHKASSLLELELAQSHLDFGWTASAADHAQHAIDLAERDLDLMGRGMSRLVLSKVARQMNDSTRAQELGDSAREILSNAGSWTALTEVRLMGLEPVPGEVVPPELAEQRMVRAMKLAGQAEAHGDLPRAARARALAAQAAMSANKSGEAVEYAESALNIAARCRGWVSHLPQMLSIGAAARRKAHRTTYAQALETRALEQLRQIASTIQDKELRRTWLATREAEGS